MGALYQPHCIALHCMQVLNAASAGASVLLVTNDEATGQLKMQLGASDADLMWDVTIPSGFVARAVAAQLWRAIQATDSITAR